jgi:hypothetical protein
VSGIFAWFNSECYQFIDIVVSLTYNYFQYQRITIPQILESSWFKKGYNPVKFQEERDTSLDDIDAVFSDSVVSDYV